VALCSQKLNCHFVQLKSRLQSSVPLLCCIHVCLLSPARQWLRVHIHKGNNFTVLDRRLFLLFFFLNHRANIVVIIIVVETSCVFRKVHFWDISVSKNLIQDRLKTELRKWFKSRPKMWNVVIMIRFWRRLFTRVDQSSSWRHVRRDYGFVHGSHADKQWLTLLATSRSRPL